MNRSTDPINVVALIRLLRRHMLLFIATGVLAGASSVGFSLWLPVYFKAKTIIFPPESKQRDLATRLVGQLPSGLGTFIGVGQSQGNQGEVWKGILKSRTVQDRLIKDHGLVAHYKVDDEVLARRKLDNLSTVDIEDGGFLRIEVEDTDREMTRTLAVAYVSALEDLNKRQNSTAAKRGRVFIENRLEKMQKELFEAEDRLRVFMETHGAFDIRDQAQAALQGMGVLRGHLVAAEVERESLLAFTTPASSQVQQLNSKIEALKKKIASITRPAMVSEGKQSSGTINGQDALLALPNLSQIPKLSLEYARLRREAEVKQTVYGVLVKELEMAKITEAQDTSTLRVLDEAVVPRYKSWPKRDIIVIAMTLAALFLCVSLLLAREAWKMSAQNGATTDDEPEGSKMSLQAGNAHQIDGSG